MKKVMTCLIIGFTLGLWKGVLVGKDTYSPRMEFSIGTPARQAGKDIDSLIKTHCEDKHHLPVSLVRAVFHTESRFNNTAVSEVGAKGIGQIMDSWTEWCGFEHYTDYFGPRPEAVENNIRCACDILAYEIENTKDIEEALKHYNGGPSYKKKGPRVVAAVTLYAKTVIDRMGREVLGALNKHFKG